MPVQRLNFTKGINKDVEDRLLDNGEYRDALNLRFISQGNTSSDGSAEPLMGTVQIDTESIADLDTPVVVGSYDNKIKKCVYYLVSSEGNHDGDSLIEYNYSNDVITVLLTSVVLGLDAAYPISGIAMVQDMLFWINGNGEPKYVNVERLRNGEYPSPILESQVTLIRPLPPDLTATENVLTSVTTSYAPIQSYQFAVQFQYLDFQWSKLSGHSELPVKTGQASYIDVTVPLGDATVRAVRLLFRVKPTDLTASDWYIYETYYPTTSSFATSEGVRYVEGFESVDDSTILVHFYNSSIYNTLDVNEGSALFDFVPRDVKALTQIDGSRLVLANGVTGYDLPESDTSATVKYNSIPASITTSVSQTGTGSGTGYVYNEYQISAIRSGETLAANLVFGLSSGTDTDLDYVNAFGYPDKGTVETGIRYLILTTDTIATVRDAIVDLINGLNNKALIRNAGNTDSELVTMFNCVPISTDSFQIRRYTVTPFADTYAIAGYSTGGFTASTSRPISVFKSGMEHEFGIIYYDAYGRSSTVLADNFTVTVDPIASSNSGTNYIEYTINHLPPSWATKYRIAMRQKTYYSIMIKSGTVSSHTIGIDWINTYNDANSNSVLSYDWVSGDRVRRVYDSSGTAFFTSTIDTEIKQYDSGALTITTEDDLSISTGDWIEIYRPAKAIEGTSIVYSNITQAYDITGGYHMGDVQDQTGAQPAILRLQSGNAYRRFRTMDGDTVYIEDSNMTDFSLTSGTSAGKPNLTDISATQKREEATAYWSNSFISNTQVNGLNSFMSNNFKDANRAYGAINKLHSNGFRLFVFQELKVSATLINKTMIDDFNGNSLVGASTAVMQDFDYFNGEFGIGRYPLSFSFNANDMYFCDPLRGAVLRLNEGGVYDISNGLRAWFNWYLSSLQQQPTLNELDLISTFDTLYGEYVLTIKAPIIFNGRCTAIQSTAEPKTRFTITLTDQTDVLEASDVIIIQYPNSSGRYETIAGTVISITGTSLVIDTNVIASIGTPPFYVKVTKEYNTTIGFNEKENRWKSRYSFIPSFYSTAGINFVSFIDENVQKHNVNSIRNNFYGTQYPWEMTCVANDEFIVPKSWLGLELNSNDTCNVTLSNNMGQESSLVTTDFERYEDFYYSNFYCDELTPNTTDPLLNGDNLRSNNLIIKLSNTATGNFRLLLVAVRYIISKFAQ